MHRGYIKIWRKIEDSGLLQMHGTLALFMLLILKAAYKPFRYGIVDLQRGQFVAGRHQLAAMVGLSEQQIRTCEKNLISLGMIEVKPTNKFTIYTIVNYDIYQDCTDEFNKQITNNQQTDNKQSTTKEELKNLRIKEIYIPPIPDDLLSEWKAVRKKKKATDITERVWNGIVREAAKARITPIRAIEICCEKGWNSFDASWINGNAAKQDEKQRNMDILTGRHRNEDHLTIDMD